MRGTVLTRRTSVLTWSGARFAALLWAVCASILGVAGPAAAPEPVPAGLELQISSPVTNVDRDTSFLISWKLTNKSAKSITVCAWPGIAFAGGWFLADGSFEGFGPGYPDTPKLSLLDFRELKPGESITGSATENAYQTAAGYIRYHAYFRSGSDGKNLGLRAWHGEIDSNVIEVQVPKAVSH